MFTKTRVAISVLVCSLIGIGIMLGQNGAPINGQWTISGPVIRDHIQLETRRTSSRGAMSSSSPIALGQLRGLTPVQLESSGSIVRFEIVRDAGTLEFQGYVQNTSGGGTFTFVPNANFAVELNSLGYPGVSEEKLFALAMHDVSATYIRR